MHKAEAISNFRDDLRLCVALCAFVLWTLSGPNEYIWHPYGDILNDKGGFAVAPG